MEWIWWVSACRKRQEKRWKASWHFWLRTRYLGLSQEHLLQRYYRAVVRQPLWRSVLSVRDLWVFHRQSQSSLVRTSVRRWRHRSSHLRSAITSISLSLLDLSFRLLRNLKKWRVSVRQSSHLVCYSLESRPWEMLWNRWHPAQCSRIWLKE